MVKLFVLWCVGVFYWLRGDIVYEVVVRWLEDSGGFDFYFCNLMM